jgi:hypothetical protein
MFTAKYWCDDLVPQKGHGFIYAIFDPVDLSRPVCVGATTLKLRRRVGGHKSTASFKPEQRLSRWINSIISEKRCPTVRILEHVIKSELGKLEELWIRFLEPLGSLANVSYGPGLRGLTPRKKNVQ